MSEKFSHLCHNDVFFVNSSVCHAGQSHYTAGKIFRAELKQFISSAYARMEPVLFVYVQDT